MAQSYDIASTTWTHPPSFSRLSTAGTIGSTSLYDIDRITDPAVRPDLSMISEAPLTEL